MPLCGLLVLKDIPASPILLRVALKYPHGTTFQGLNKLGKIEIDLLFGKIGTKKGGAPDKLITTYGYKQTLGI